MKKKKNRPLLILVILLGVTLACNYSRFSAPTAIVFPTPDFTMTALFNPTLTSPPVLTSTPTLALPTNIPPTGTSIATGTNTSVPTPTSTPLPPTPTPTRTNSPTPSFVGPGSRPNYGLAAFYFSNPPEIDTNSDDWKVDPYPIEAVVFGKSDYKGVGDLSARVRVGWDFNNLYLFVRVFDDVYVQNASGANLFKGDSLEILLDTNVSDDFYLAALTSDDFQLGISPGIPGPDDNVSSDSSAPGQDSEAYLWYPTSLAGSKSGVVIASRDRVDGYVVEAAISWSVFNVQPKPGRHFGFAFSVSDNDNPDKNLQQTMISSSPIRILADPTTWGDLVIIQD
jgi:hypothetical protein